MCFIWKVWKASFVFVCAKFKSALLVITSTSACFYLRSHPVPLHHKGWQSTRGHLHRWKERVLVFVLRLSWCCLCWSACWSTGQKARLDGMQTMTYRWWWKLWQIWGIAQVPVAGLWLPSAASAGFFLELHLRIFSPEALKLPAEF